MNKFKMFLGYLNTAEHFLRRYHLHLHREPAFNGGRASWNRIVVSERLKRGGCCYCVGGK